MTRSSYEAFARYVMTIGRSTGPVNRLLLRRRSDRLIHAAPIGVDLDGKRSHFPSQTHSPP
jgi:hypothetical protein